MIRYYCCTYLYPKAGRKISKRPDALISSQIQYKKLINTFLRRAAYTNSSFIDKKTSFKLAMIKKMLYSWRFWCSGHFPRPAFGYEYVCCKELRSYYFFEYLELPTHAVSDCEGQ